MIGFDGSFISILSCIFYYRHDSLKLILLSLNVSSYFIVVICNDLEIYESYSLFSTLFVLIITSSTFGSNNFLNYFNVSLSLSSTYFYSF